MSKSLQLFLVKPQVNPQSPMAIINLQETLPIQVNISAENVDACFVNLRYDVNHLKLIEGAELNSLGSGSFSKQLSWLLKAIKISYNNLWTEIIAEAGGLFQAVGFDIKITSPKAQ